MMGRQEPGQTRLFYDFCLEDQVPADHILRRLNDHLDLSWLREDLKPFYSSLGRPSIDPELMIRMLLVGYCFSIRSERKLCEELRFNLAFKWFCRLGLEDPIPDHSTFSKARHGRFSESDVFRSLFEDIVTRCIETGLVAGEGFAIDASVIEADASRYHKVDGSKGKGLAGEAAGRPVRDYLSALASGDPLITPKTAPKQLSPCDPAAAWTTRGTRNVEFAYSINHLVDLENGIVLDVEATPSRLSHEVAALDVMLDRAHSTFDLKPRRLAADTAYGSGEVLAQLAARGIAPHIPVKDNSHTTTGGRFTKADFAFDPARNVYVCPNGKLLRTSGTAHEGTTLRYVARSSDCLVCPLKQNCTRAPERRIARNTHEDLRDQVRGLMGSKAFKTSVRQRKKVERGFGDLKRNLGLMRLRLRGLSGAREEFLLASSVQNLKKLAKHQHPPPSDASGGGQG